MDIGGRLGNSFRHSLYSGISAWALSTRPTPRPIGVMAGTVASNLMSDRPLAAAIFKGLCNVSEPVIVAWFLERWFGPKFSFEDLRRVLGFLTAAAVAPPMAEIAVATAIMLLQTKAPYWDLWRAWFL